RGGHYGQRSCEPRFKAEHTGAPTNSASVKKVLANSEPSTQGGEANMYWQARLAGSVENDPDPTFAVPLARHAPQFSTCYRQTYATVFGEGGSL
ncbi:MAG: hypothetical protein WBF03_10950, partial [Xanthobacteraceae bacterium]